MRATTEREGNRSLTIGLNEFRAREIPRASDGKNLLFSQLPNAENESREVGSRLGAEVWTGADQVTKEKILNRLAHIDLEPRNLGYRSPLVIHIASHGFCLAQDGEAALRVEDLEETHRIRLALQRSGLALSGAADSADLLRGVELLSNGIPGILGAYEISGLDLRDTELVVLSACESGIGLVSSGEGVFGLQRAFFIAGSRSLVMTLWRVDHMAAGILMNAFYAGLERGESRSTALRRAQLHVRRKLPWPACWGAFVCQGSPLPIAGITPANRTSPTT